MERLHSIGKTKQDIEKEITETMEEMLKEPKEEEIILNSIKTSEFTHIETKYLSESMAISNKKEVCARPATAGSTILRNTMTMLNIKGSEEKPDITQNVSSNLVRDTEEAFVGNPLKALRYNKTKEYKSHDIHSLINKFKITSEITKEVSEKI